MDADRLSWVLGEKSDEGNGGWIDVVVGGMGVLEVEALALWG